MVDSANLNHIHMKKTLITIAALALTSMSNAATFVLDLTPTGGGAQNTVQANGITPEQVFARTTDDWFGTIQNSSLNNQVQLNDGSLNLQIGAVAAQNKGNCAALHFDMPVGVTSAELSFTFTKASQWGANLANFECDYTCTVYGFDSTGAATEIGTTTLQNVKTTIAQNEPQNVSFTLNVDPNTNYSSYGVIFSGIDTSTVGSSAGLSANITNIQITGDAPAVPEPATASLSLLGLGALLLRRRRS